MEDITTEAKRVVAVVQGRMDSARLPGKVLLDLEGKPVLIRIIERLLRAKTISQIVVATTANASDRAIVEAVKQYYPEIPVYCGSENDLLDRIYQATKDLKPAAVVRITADSPLVDRQIVDQVVATFLNTKTDYASNALEVKKYPVGYELEVFSFSVLEKLWRERTDVKEREFPSLYIREHLNEFTCEKVICEKDYSFHRWTLDEPADYELVKTIYHELYPKKPDFLMTDILELLDKRPELIQINQHVNQRWKNY